VIGIAGSAAVPSEWDVMPEVVFFYKISSQMTVNSGKWPNGLLSGEIFQSFLHHSAITFKNSSKIQ
jgi:hypothetical protein